MVFHKISNVSEIMNFRLAVACYFAYFLQRMGRKSIED
jgi:hypothetical protein